MNGRRLLLAVLALTVISGSALAQTPRNPVRLPCSDYQKIASQLDKRYEEAPVSMGIQSNGNLLQIFASKESGTWTVLSIAPTGKSCIIAAGKSWESFDAVEFEPET